MIVYAGPESGLRRSELPRDALEIHARGAAVVPGFVDAHTHIVWLGDRGDEYAQRASGATYEEIAAAGGGIRATVRATAAGDVDELVAAARERARRMLAGGTTTVEVKSGYGLEYDAEMRQLDAAERLRQWEDLPDVVATYLPLHAAPDGPREAFIDDACTRGVAGAAKRARFVDAFCETGAYTVAECERLFTAAKAQGLRPKIHAEQRTHSGGALLAAQSRRCERRSPRACDEHGSRSAEHRRHGRRDPSRRLDGARRPAAAGSTPPRSRLHGRGGDGLQPGHLLQRIDATDDLAGRRDRRAHPRPGARGGDRPVAPRRSASPIGGCCVRDFAATR